jgi:hypothetical protein
MTLITLYKMHSNICHISCNVVVFNPNLILTVHHLGHSDNSYSLKVENKNRIE